MKTSSQQQNWVTSFSAFVWNNFTLKKNAIAVFAKAQWLGMQREEAVTSLLDFLRARSAEIAISADELVSLWASVEQELSLTSKAGGAE